MTFLVWPHGHPAMTYADFPEIRNTHIDIYLGFAKTYSDSRAGGYIIAGKPPAGIANADVIGPCLNYGTALAKPGPIANAKTISRPATVDCTFSWGPSSTSSTAPAKRNLHPPQRKSDTRERTRHHPQPRHHHP